MIECIDADFFRLYWSALVFKDIDMSLTLSQTLALMIFWRIEFGISSEVATD